MKRKIMLGSKLDKNTILLLHLDGNIIDSSRSNITMTKTGTSFVAGIFGQGLSFSATDKISGEIPVIGTGDFTIELWVYRRFSTAYQKFAETGNDSTIGAFNFDTDSSGSHLRFYSSRGEQVLSSSSFPFPIEAWVHIAAVRKGAGLDLYQNGQFVGTTIMTTNFSATTLTVRASSCVIDELRISNVARWTSNFTPPTKPY